METDTLAMAQEIDFSLLALFARATLTVKIVMIMLMVMSFWSWAIIIQKHIMFRRRAPRRKTSTAPSGRASRWMSCYEKIGPTRRGERKDLCGRDAGMAAQPPAGRRADRRRAGAHRPGDGRGDCRESERF
jgi:biopolymer transport protein TolQ